MREIKFRGWDTRLSRWVSDVLKDKDAVDDFDNEFYWEDEWYPMSNAMEFEDFPKMVNHLDWLIVEQYTGLKDANGVEIYEGDILECLAEDDEDKDKCVVEFAEGMFGGKGDGYWLPLRTLRMEESIVVGNIHENPELLDETK